TDLPFLVTLEQRGDAYVPGRFLSADLLGGTSENAAAKTVLLDASGAPVVPRGSLGFRYGEAGQAQGHRELGGVDPLPPAAGPTARAVPLLLPRFDEPDAPGGSAAGVLRRGVPAREVGGRLVATVYDLVLAQYGVARDGLPGEWPQSYDDPQPYTPAWQERITGVPASKAARIAREFARNAEESGG